MPLDAASRHQRAMVGPESVGGSWRDPPGLCAGLLPCASESVLEWSQANFGESARRRYQALVAAAIRDVSADPKGVGCQACPELGEGVYSWHLRMSRDRSKAEPVQRPRHFLIYRIDHEVVVIGCILHDVMDLPRPIHAHTTWE